MKFFAKRASESRAPGDKKYRGEVVYIFAFDLAYDMTRARVDTLLGKATEDYLISSSKRSPRNLFFYSPQEVILEPEKRQLDGRSIEIRRSVKVFHVGAISIKVHVPFEVERIEELVAYHELDFESGSLIGEVTALAEKVRADLEPYCINPVGKIREGEAYTVFCINKLPETADTPSLHAEDWLSKNRREVAGLLTQEEDSAHISEQEAAESTGAFLSYYYSDLVVIDWDAALVVGEQDSLDDILHIMEVANVQLVELGAYDRILDESLEQAYKDVARSAPPVKRKVTNRLREIRVDLARLSDELLNITKFFGDWHLAKIYRDLSGRFHLSDWHNVVDEKLDTLGSLYQLLQQDRVNLWMVTLEMAIVVLFIIDVVMLFAGL